MPEYGAGCLWARDNEEEPFYSIDPGEVGISIALINQLEAFNNIYQDTLNEDYPPDSRFPSKDAESDFEKRGIDIWEKLSLELSPDITIIYHSVVQDKTYNHISDLKT